MGPWSSAPHQSKRLWLWHWPGWLILTFNSRSIYGFFIWSWVLISTLNSSLKLTGAESAEAAPQIRVLGEGLSARVWIQFPYPSKSDACFTLPLSPSLVNSGASQESQKSCPSWQGCVAVFADDRGPALPGASPRWQELGAAGSGTDLALSGTGSQCQISLLVFFRGLKRDWSYTSQQKISLEWNKRAQAYVLLLTPGLAVGFPCASWAKYLQFHIQLLLSPKFIKYIKHTPCGGGFLSFRWEENPVVLRMFYSHNRTQSTRSSTAQYFLNWKVLPALSAGKPGMLPPIPERGKQHSVCALQLNVMD